jgi:xylulokinase
MTTYLGFDLSTQSLSALVIDLEHDSVPIHETVEFGTAFPQFGCLHGFLVNRDPRVRHADPLVWVAALDRVLEQVAARGFQLGRIAAVCGAGQQHGSVYLSRAMDTIGDWDSSVSLISQVRRMLSRRTAPIWMDSSTRAECLEVTRFMGGDRQMIERTGSPAIERFTAAQIRKFSKDSPVEYEQTGEVHLVSSFLASILAARSSGIELGDGLGTNLVDLRTRTWIPELCAQVAPGLPARLPAIVAPSTVVGAVAGYFQRKYGFRPNTPIIVFSGDNPSSLVGVGASRSDTMAISLGTSDTMFAATDEPRIDPAGYGHVFGDPAGSYMSLLCFANGALTRARVAGELGLDWSGFERAIVEATAPGNAGNFMLPYFAPEVTPWIPDPHPRRFGEPDFVAGARPAAIVRATVEAQALTMRLHAAWMGDPRGRLRVTGGGGQNAGIRQVFADVFQAELTTISVTNSSALGAALRAAHHVGQVPWPALFERFAQPDPRTRTLPNPDTREVYADLLGRFAEQLMQIVGDPPRPVALDHHASSSREIQMKENQ